MSADNYYIIRKHPDGGFAAPMGFDSDDRTPSVDPKRHQSFPTLDAAADWAAAQYSEYGVSVHDECRTSPAEPTTNGDNA